MMPTHDPLDGLLAICDEIRKLQDRSRRHPGIPDGSRVDRMRTRVQSLRTDVFCALPGLIQNARGSALDDAELLVLALLFHARVSDRDSALTGSQLVALLSQAGFGRTEVLALLDPAGELIRSGWLRIERRPGDGHYPLDAAFHPSLVAMDLFWPSLAEDQEPPARPDQPAQPYCSEEECLWDYYRWRNLCIQRAGALFDPERSDAMPAPRYRALRREARAALVRTRARLSATPSGREFRLERFRKEQGLGSDHMLLVLHLLFAELVEGEPYLSALECLRLVAETRSDLFRKRRIVSRHGRLRREGLLKAASEEFEKALATDLSLSDWVADDILAGFARSPRLAEGELDDLLRGEEE